MDEDDDLNHVGGLEPWALLAAPGAADNEIDRLIQALGASEDVFVAHEARIGLGDFSVIPVMLVGAASALLPKVWGALSVWLSQDRRRRVKLVMGQTEIEITNAAPEEQRALVLAWITAALQDYQRQTEKQERRRGD